MPEFSFLRHYLLFELFVYNFFIFLPGTCWQKTLPGRQQHALALAPALDDVFVAAVAIIIVGTSEPQPLLLLLLLSNKQPQQQVPTKTTASGSQQQRQRRNQCRSVDKRKCNKIVGKLPRRDECQEENGGKHTHILTPPRRQAGVIEWPRLPLSPLLPRETLPLLARDLKWAAHDRAEDFPPGKFHMHCARALNVIIVLIAQWFPTKAKENNVAGGRK